MIVTNDFFLAAQTQPLNIAGGGGYSFCIRPGKSTIGAMSTSSTIRNYPASYTADSFAGGFVNSVYDTNGLFPTLFPTLGGASLNSPGPTNGIVAGDGTGFGNAFPGTTGTTGSTAQWAEASYPWRWGSFPLKVTAIGYDSKISTFFINSSETYYIGSGFTMLKVESLVQESTGYFTCTVGTDPSDRIIANRDQYRVTQKFIIDGGWTYNSATANNPLNWGSPRSCTGLPLKNAVAWRVSIQADFSNSTATLTSGTLQAWYNPLLGIDPFTGFSWAFTDFSFSVPSGATRYTTPDNPVAVPSGYLWIEPKSVVTSSATAKYCIILEVTYASQP